MPALISCNHTSRYIHFEWPEAWTPICPRTPGWRHFPRSSPDIPTFLFGSPVCRKDPINSPLSIHQSVRNALFSELFHYFFLKYCMRLEINKRSKVTEPDFSGKFWFSPKRGKKGPEMAKIGFLDFCRKLSH